MKTQIINTCVILIMLLTPSFSFAISATIGNVSAKRSENEAGKLNLAENKGVQFIADFKCTTVNL